MSTLHLHYKSFDHIADKLYNPVINFEKNTLFKEYIKYYFDQELHFTKKISINNILTYLPNDVCNIINKYCYTNITLNCNVIKKPNNDEYLEILYNNDVFGFHIYPVSHEIHIWTCKILHVRQTGYKFLESYYLYNIMNKFMEHNYNKFHYFNCNHIPTTYVTNGRFKNTVVLNGDLCTGITIYNRKQFKYMIVMIKCILNAMIKYEGLHEQAVEKMVSSIKQDMNN